MNKKLENPAKSNIALVLSGGGALGAAHIGAIKHLEKIYSPSYLIGTSAGSIVSAAIACGLSSAEISDYLNQKRLLSLAFDFSIGGSGLIRGRKILDLLKKVYQDKNFADLPTGMTLKICTTDFESGESVIIDSGSIAEAVRASLSVPGLFEPFQVQGRLLVDGGLVCNFPLQYAIKEFTGDKIVGVDVCSNFSRIFPPLGKKRASFRQVLERSIRIMFHSQQSNIPNDSRVVVIRPKLEEYNGADILYLKEIEQLGYQAAIDCMVK